MPARAGPVRSGCCPGRQGGPGSCAVDCGSYTPRPSTRGLIVAPGVFPRRSDSIDRCNISEVQLTLLPASVAIRLAGRREPHRLHRRGAAAPAGPGKSPDRRGVGHLGRGDECAACLIGVAPARASRGGPTAGGRLASLLGSHLRRAPGQRPAGRTVPAGEPGRPADGEPVRLYRSGRATLTDLHATARAENGFGSKVPVAALGILVRQCRAGRSTSTRWPGSSSPARTGGRCCWSARWMWPPARTERFPAGVARSP